ncbi:hypothetical protein VPHK567_0203 [Vibrio phage K567]
MNVSQLLDQARQLQLIVKRIALDRHDDDMLVVSTCWTGIYYKVMMCKKGRGAKPFTEIIRTSELEERLAEIKRIKDEPL